MGPDSGGNYWIETGGPNLEWARKMEAMRPELRHRCRSDGMEAEPDPDGPRA